MMLYDEYAKLRVEQAPPVLHGLRVLDWVEHVRVVARFNNPVDVRVVFDEWGDGDGIIGAADIIESRGILDLSTHLEGRSKRVPWSKSDPARLPAFAAGIVVHEMAHLIDPREIGYYAKIHSETWERGLRRLMLCLTGRVLPPSPRGYVWRLQRDVGRILHAWPGLERFRA